MDRSIESPDHELDPRPEGAKAKGVSPRDAVDGTDDRQSGRGGASAATRVRQPSREDRQVYLVSSNERQTMFDIGRFRVISTDDLVTLNYRGNQAQMRQDLRSLMGQRLIERKTVWTGRDREKQSYLALTPAGKRLLKREQGITQGQAVYTGFVKPAELRHDAAIFRMYHLEAARIQSDGGRIRRVVLDYELKKKAYSPLAIAKGLPTADYAKRQLEIAEQNGLKIVNGHIALPDLRIEYETSLGVSAQIDLELATESYHGSHAAEKAAAGFKMYASAETAAHLTSALEEREITAEILSL